MGGGGGGGWRRFVLQFNDAAVVDVLVGLVVDVGVQFLDTVVDLPVVVQVVGCRAENRGNSAVAVLGQGGDMPVVVNDRCLEVPQVQFLWL